MPEDDISAAIDADLAAQEAESPAEDQAGEEVSTPEVSSEVTTYTMSDGTEVSLDELEKGYLRQSDYTRKTQEAARQRDEAAQAMSLLQALQEDPEGTLEVLQRNLLAEQDNENLDPVEARLREHDQFIEEQQNARFEAELQQELDAVAQEFGSVDRDAVLQYAIDNEIPNLRAAHLDMTYVMERDAKRTAGNAQALERKRNAPPVAGRGRAAGGDSVEFKPVKTMNDAYENALAELGADYR